VKTIDNSIKTKKAKKEKKEPKDKSNLTKKIYNIQFMNEIFEYINAQS